MFERLAHTHQNLQTRAVDRQLYECSICDLMQKQKQINATRSRITAAVATVCLPAHILLNPSSPAHDNSERDDKQTQKLADLLWVCGKS